MVNPISAQVLRDKFGSQSPVYTNTKRDLMTLWAEVKDEPEITVKFCYWRKTAIQNGEYTGLIRSKRYYLLGFRLESEQHKRGKKGWKYASNKTI